MTEENVEYEAPEVTDMVIKSTDAKMYGWKQLKGRKAKPAVEAVEGRSAVAATKDEDGNIVSEGSPAIKAVKAQDAVEGIPACQHVHVQAKTIEILDECVARLADQGFRFPDTAAPGETEYGFGMWIVIGPEKEDMTALRQAFKKVKGKDDYNAPGLALLKEEKEAKRAEERAAKKAAKEKAAEEAKAQAEAEVESDVEEDSGSFDE